MASIMYSKHQPFYIFLDAGTPILYFMLVAAGLLTWLIFCWRCSKCLLQRIRPITSATPQMTLHSNVSHQVPVCPVQQVSNNCQETTTTEETEINQTRNKPVRMPVKSQHIYDYVDDLVIEKRMLQGHVNSDGRQAACVESTEDTDCASCNTYVTKRETDLNPYQTLKDKRDTKAHEYIDMPTATDN